jgi:hypothetical protein
MVNIKISEFYNINSIIGEAIACLEARGVCFSFYENFKERRNLK